MKLTQQQRRTLERAVGHCWPRATAHWSAFLLLSTPVLDGSHETPAQIDLRTRQISLNGGQILERGLLGSMEAILAHEVGHHVRHPGELRVEARLQILERELLPPGLSLINLFQDLMINAHLAPALGEQLEALYREFVREGLETAHGLDELDPAFLFYLAASEEMWRLPPGALLDKAAVALERRDPQYRAEARRLARNLAALEPEVYTQFLYFLSVVLPYLEPRARVRLLVRHRCGRAAPSAEDWADALQPTEQEQQAIDRARAEGWFLDEQAQRLPRSADQRLRVLRGGSAGQGRVRNVPEVMAAHYRREAERYLRRPPPARTARSEPLVPAALEEWEPGEPLADIDWAATLGLRGELYGAACPLRRERHADDLGAEAPRQPVRSEIYLDASRSMPDPCEEFSPMTLAALILALGTLRAGGQVRAVLYSETPVALWQWCRSERLVSRFLMRTIGEGTDFPFGLLERSLRECREEQPLRFVLSDEDFCGNLEALDASQETFARAASLSPRLVVLLQCVPVPRGQQLERHGALVIPVNTPQAWERTAVELCRLLFPEDADECL